MNIPYNSQPAFAGICSVGKLKYKSPFRSNLYLAGFFTLFYQYCFFPPTLFPKEHFGLAYVINANVRTEVN